MSAIAFQNVSKWYGEVVALNKVDFTIGAGVTGLLGPNGAGKSTIMNLCTGQARPSQGDVNVLGESTWCNYPLLRRIGLCPERENYYDDMTGYEFVYWLTRCTGMHSAPARKAALESLDRVGMSGRMNDAIAGYSRGMRQRVKLAQSFAHGPDVLFLDEPLTGLDPVGRSTIFELIREIGREGKTVVVSSHVLYEIENVTRTIVLINKGRVLAHGDIHEIRALIDAHPHSVTVRCAQPRKLASALVASPHVVNVELESDGAGVTIHTRDANTFYDQVNALLSDPEFAVESMHSPDDNLQAVFEYLVR